VGNCGEAYFGAEGGEEYMLVDKEAILLTPHLDGV
jgi:hypothetical protein